ncbi:MAG: nitroreductase family protein [Bacteroidales bacterium]|nr:nitroreductase family protein [Bacteroidales bacterium]
MADNYLEKKFEEFRSKAAVKKRSVSLGTLLRQNRSYRGYDKTCVVTQAQLHRIAEVCTKVPSGRNQQVLRFKLLTRENGSEKMQGLYKLGAALPELHLPFPGTEPEAFILICSTVTPDKWVHMDVGIAAQSMLLKAVEMGLGGICIGAFNKEKVTDTFGLPCEPVLILAIGKPAEKIELVPVRAGEPLKYYRENGVHFVPKITADDLIL